MVLRYIPLAIGDLPPLEGVVPRYGSTAGTYRYLWLCRSFRGLRLYGVSTRVFEYNMNGYTVLAVFECIHSVRGF